jgi:hypothetical protein
MKSLTSGSTFRGVLALLAVTLLAVGCSSSTGVTEPPDGAAATNTTATAVPPTPAPLQAQPVSNLPTIEQVAPELAGLGTLIAVHSEPVQQIFDSAGGSLTLADGALVQVPTDSFPAPTNVNMVVTDLLFGKYLDDAPQGRIYRLATVEEVTLLRPMVLEIAKPADSVTVLMLEDGVWTEQTIPDLDTTRVEITHFSANHVAIIDKADCSLRVNAQLPGCQGANPLRVSYHLINKSGGVGSGDIAPVLSETEAAACNGLCPTRTAPGAPSQASIDDSATTQPPAAAPPAAAPPAAAPPAAPPAAAPPAAAPPAANQGCQSPKVELDRFGSKSCVTEAVCLSVGFGWSYQNGKCTGPPPCEGESLGHYSRDHAGVCRSPMYGCAHPKLDYPHLGGCITRQDCSPSSDGFTIEGSSCEFFEGDCYFGYVWNGSHCVTQSMGCKYPKVDFTGQGNSGCVTVSECQAFGSGYYYLDDKCYPPDLG